MGPRPQASPQFGGIATWAEFLEALDDFENIVQTHWDSEQESDLPPRLATLGLNLARWIAEKTPHDPAPMLDVYRAIQAKDPLGHLTAFRVPVAEVDKLLWRWWPTREMLVDSALAAVGQETESPPESQPPKEPAPRGVETLLGPEGAEILRVSQSAQRVDDRMRSIISLDSRLAGYSSVEWSSLLGVTESAIKKTSTWKVIQSSRRGMPN